MLNKSRYGILIFLAFILCVFPVTPNTLALANTDEEKTADNVLPMTFKPMGKGTFIYCNNPEWLTPEDLSTIENPNPTYIMSNPDLTPGDYSMFICLYNNTSFNIEADVEFKSKTNSVIKITSVGFNVPYNDEFWDCLDTWTDYRNIKIRTVDGSKEYLPYEGITSVPTEFKVTSSSSEWLNRYIHNYQVVGAKKCFNMLVDFTVVSGTADVNIAALKNYGILGDRSKHAANAAPGKYKPDGTIKGIVDTLPVVEASVDLNITSALKNGFRVPVKVYNQYYPDGNITDVWMTNINPNADAFMESKHMSTASDMLEIKYEDNGKLDFYGKYSPVTRRNTIWNFDIFHELAAEYAEGMPHEADSHVPNKTIKPSLEDIPIAEHQTNLGNFGVTYRYHLNLQNTDNVTRVLNYNLITSRTSNIVIMRDKHGNIVNPYTLDNTKEAFALSKGISEVRKDATMASIPLNPGESKYFIMDVIMPTNTFGGVQNCFVISDRKFLNEHASTDFGTYRRKPDYIDILWTGEEYMRWEGVTLQKSTDGVKWTEVLLNSEAREIFLSNMHDYTITKVDHGYIARFSTWDYSAGMIWGKHLQSKVYVFDDDFQFLDAYDFEDYVNRIVPTPDRRVYAMSDVNYLYYPYLGWRPFDNGYSMPISNGKSMLAHKDGDIYLNSSLNDYTKINYESREPENIRAVKDMFYYQPSWKETFTDTETKNIISFSNDGFYWTDIEFPDRLLDLRHVYEYKGRIYVQTRYETFSINVNNLKGKLKEFNGPLIELDGEILIADTPAQIIEERTLVPLRFFFEKLGAQVEWRDEEQAVVISQSDRTIVFRINETEALINDEIQYMDTTAMLINNKTMVPLRFLSEALWYKVDWDEERYAIIISS